MEAHAIPKEKPFMRAQASFTELAHKLGDPALDGAHHGTVEELVWSEGLEILRLLYEDHMNLRAQALPESEVVGSDSRRERTSALCRASRCRASGGSRSRNGKAIGRAMQALYRRSTRS